MGGFRDFIARGNVLDLAVAVIIGAAFGTIVNSVADDLIMPVIGVIVGGLDFSNYFVRVGPLPASYAGDPHSYAALKSAGVAVIGYGAFVTAVVKFLILAFVIYQIVRLAKRLTFAGEQAKPTLLPSDELVVLREIRDELRRKP